MWYNLDSKGISKFPCFVMMRQEIFWKRMKVRSIIMLSRCQLWWEVDVTGLLHFTQFPLWLQSNTLPKTTVIYLISELVDLLVIFSKPIRMLHHHSCKVPLFKIIMTPFLSSLEIKYVFGVIQPLYMSNSKEGRLYQNYSACC